MKNHTQLVKLLLSFGANADMKDMNGDCPREAVDRLLKMEQINIGLKAEKQNKKKKTIIFI